MPSIRFLFLTLLLLQPALLHAKASQADIDECNGLVTTALNEQTLTANGKEHRKVVKLCKKGKTSAVEKVLTRLSNKSGKGDSATCLTTLASAVSDQILTTGNKEYRKAEKLCKKGKLDAVEKLIERFTKKKKGDTSQQELITACLSTLEQALGSQLLHKGSSDYRKAEKLCKKGKSSKVDLLITQLEKKKGGSNLKTKKEACLKQLKAAASRNEVRKNSSSYKKLTRQCKSGSFTAVETALAKVATSTTSTSSAASTATSSSSTASTTTTPSTTTTTTPKKKSVAEKKTDLKGKCVRAMNKLVSSGKLKTNSRDYKMGALFCKRGKINKAISIIKRYR